MFKLIFGKKENVLKEGRWKEFNKHAVLISVGNYVKGKKHGPWSEYYDTGELMLEENYHHGVLNGRFATYHTNGRLQSEGVYAGGSREGQFKIYSDTGLHVKSLFFIENNLIEETNASATFSSG